jgi:hypothetical protein
MGKAKEEDEVKLQGKTCVLRVTNHLFMFNRF